MFDYLGDELMFFFCHKTRIRTGDITSQLYEMGVFEKSYSTKIV